MPEPRRICLICVEIFAWGKYGGFGKAARIIGRELVKRGYDVYAVVPRREDQKEEEVLDGIKVMSFLPDEVLSSGKIYKQINADVYHSCEPSLGTWLARQKVPRATHIVTCRDPRNYYDWWLEFSYPSKSRAQVIKNILYEHNFLVKHAVRKADAVYVPAKFLKEKVRKIYNVRGDINFIPTPIEIPEPGIKSALPSVISMGRLDPRKRPELTLKLAEKFPDVAFHIAGKARVPEYEEHLKKKYGHQPNLYFHGFIDQFKSDMHHRMLSGAWILVNTAVREGLPDSFVEAAGQKCAILSHVDPDGFASQFGYHALHNDFEKGLTTLLANDLWKTQGEKGHAYVKETFDVSLAMDQHEKAYHHHFKNKKAR
jgi:glycosyltransferase involved in cell wall biosynthesis